MGVMQNKILYETPKGEIHGVRSGEREGHAKQAINHQQNNQHSVNCKIRYSVESVRFLAENLSFLIHLLPTEQRPVKYQDEKYQKRKANKFPPR